MATSSELPAWPKGWEEISSSNPFQEREKIKVSGKGCHIAAVVILAVAVVALAIFIIAMVPPAAAIIIPAGVSILAVQIGSGVTAFVLGALGFALLGGGIFAKKQEEKEMKILGDEGELSYILLQSETDEQDLLGH